MTYRFDCLTNFFQFGSRAQFISSIHFRYQFSIWVYRNFCIAFLFRIGFWCRSSAIFLVPKRYWRYFTKSSFKRKNNFWTFRKTQKITGNASGCQQFHQYRSGDFVFLCGSRYIFGGHFTHFKIYFRSDCGHFFNLAVWWGFTKSVCQQKQHQIFQVDCISCRGTW